MFRLLSFRASLVRLKTMMTQRQKILCIEDDEATCELIEFVFKDAGCDVISCSRTECLKLILDGDYTAIVLDNFFDGISGVRICGRIRAINRTVPVVFLSGEVRPAEIEKAMAAGADAYLTKPNDFERLVPTVLSLLQNRQ